MLFKWILSGCVFVLLLLFTVDTLIGLMYRNKSKPHRIDLQKYGISFNEIQIPVTQDTSLYGWWIPASKDAPTLILMHGWGRNLERMLPYIRKLHPMGYNLVAFDARNHGRSSPIKHPTVGTFSEDILATVDYVSKSNLVSSKDIGVIGHSIGGGAAINAAGMDKRIKSVITVGAIAHPIDEMKVEFQKRHIPNFIPWLIFKYMQFRYGLDFDKLAPVNKIPNAEAKILLIHGDEDTIVPLVQGQMLEKAGNPEKTHLWIMPGKGHSDCETSPRFWEKVATFLQETLPIS